ncbi:MAG: DUF4230 domain-containing protein [Gammaproteobacteria bacterium]|nr:DUF4230 domain-containing protein [Gammaproteobacteria bacterium]
MIMLSGIMYLGFKVNEKHALRSSSKTGEQQPTSTNPHHTENTPAHVLEILQAEQLAGSLIYKTKIILLDTTSQDTSPNRDALWQQGQKQLTLVQATVHVAVDLSELTLQSITSKNATSVVLPPARIMTTEIDSLTSYDTKTGLPSTVQLGLSMTSAQEQDVKLQIEHDLCASGVLQTSTDDAQQRVVALLASKHIPSAVTTTDPVLCRKAAS